MCIALIYSIIQLKWWCYELIARETIICETVKDWYYIAMDGNFIEHYQER